MTNKDIKNYFYKKKPVGAIVLLIIGIIFFISGIASDGAFLLAILGLMMSAGGIYFIVKYNNKISNREIDNYCNTIFNEYAKAKEAIVSSNNEIITDSVFSSEYCFENMFSARKAFKGKDNIWRSSLLKMTCVFFTKNKVYYYNKIISLLTSEQSEKQMDFKISDISTISLEERNNSYFIAIIISGNEKIFVNCKSHEEALQLYNKIKRNNENL